MSAASVRSARDAWYEALAQIGDLTKRAAAGQRVAGQALKAAAAECDRTFKAYIAESERDDEDLA